MRSINRSALVVRPKEPYVRWAAALSEEAPDLTADLRSHVSVYLVAHDPRGEEESAPIEDYFERIFEQELEAWHLDENDWPRHRTFAMFREWFDVQAESLIVDLGDDEIMVEAHDASARCR